MKLRLVLAFVLGFGLAYAWQHKPATPPCAVPVDAELRDILHWKPWEYWRGA